MISLLVDLQLNSEILFLFPLFLLYSCGVKAPPVKFKDKAIDSYLENYTGQKNSATTAEKKLEPVEEKSEQKLENQPAKSQE